MAFTDADKLHLYKVKEYLQKSIREIGSSNYLAPYALPWKGVYLTGGAIASAIQDESPRDFDFYCEDEKTMREFEEHLTKSCFEHIKDVEEKYHDLIGRDGKMITGKAITMKNGASFITMIYGKPEDVKRSFDFVHCTPHYHIGTTQLFISERQYRACKDKKLIVNNPDKVKPWREDKFKSRGYTKE